ncbi:MAG: DUF3592 domain-containing protein [Candidatus Micrarchaeota archaeon]|nr:DUF3592 domain-containing protein [Candidatus Micrarchaeota archaeon]
MKKELRDTILCMVIGVCLLVLAGYLIYSDVSAQNNWTTVSGTITQSDVRTVPGKHGPQFSPRIHYTYIINGKTYGGDCCSSHTSQDKSDIQKVVDRNSINTTVNVLIDPNDPTQSKLKEETTPFASLNILALVAGLIFTFAGLQGWKKIRNKN